MNRWESSYLAVPLCLCLRISLPLSDGRHYHHIFILYHLMMPLSPFAPCSPPSLRPFSQRARRAKKGGKIEPQVKVNSAVVDAVMGNTPETPESKVWTQGGRRMRVLSTLLA